MAATGKLSGMERPLSKAQKPVHNLETVQGLYPPPPVKITRWEYPNRTPNILKRTWLERDKRDMGSSSKPMRSKWAYGHAAEGMRQGYRQLCVQISDYHEPGRKTEPLKEKERKKERKKENTRYV